MAKRRGEGDGRSVKRARKKDAKRTRNAHKRLREDVPGAVREMAHEWVTRKKAKHTRKEHDGGRVRPMPTHDGGAGAGVVATGKAKKKKETRRKRRKRRKRQAQTWQQPEVHPMPLAKGDGASSTAHTTQQLAVASPKKGPFVSAEVASKRSDTRPVPAHAPRKVIRLDPSLVAPKRDSTAAANAATNELHPAAASLVRQHRRKHRSNQLQISDVNSVPQDGQLVRLLDSRTARIVGPRDRRGLYSLQVSRKGDAPRLRRAQLALTRPTLLLGENDVCMWRQVAHRDSKVHLASSHRQKATEAGQSEQQGVESQRRIRDAAVAQAAPPGTWIYLQAGRSMHDRWTRDGITEAELGLTLKIGDAVKILDGRLGRVRQLPKGGGRYIIALHSTSDGGDEMASVSQRIFSAELKLGRHQVLKQIGVRCYEEPRRYYDPRTGQISAVPTRGGVKHRVLPPDPGVARAALVNGQMQPAQVVHSHYPLSARRPPPDQATLQVGADIQEAWHVLETLPTPRYVCHAYRAKSALPSLSGSASNKGVIRLPTRVLTEPHAEDVDGSESDEDAVAAHRSAISWLRSKHGPSKDAVGGRCRSTQKILKEVRAQLRALYDDMVCNGQTTINLGHKRVEDSCSQHARTGNESGEIKASHSARKCVPDVVQKLDSTEEAVDEDGWDTADEEEIETLSQNVRGSQGAEVEDRQVDTVAVAKLSVSAAGSQNKIGNDEELLESEESDSGSGWGTADEEDVEMLLSHEIVSQEGVQSVQAPTRTVPNHSAVSELSDSDSESGDASVGAAQSEFTRRQTKLLQAQKKQLLAAAPHRWLDILASRPTSALITHKETVVEQDARQLVPWGALSAQTIAFMHQLVAQVRELHLDEAKLASAAKKCAARQRIQRRFIQRELQNCMAAQPTWTREQATAVAEQLWKAHRGPQSQLERSAAAVHQDSEDTQGGPDGSYKLAQYATQLAAASVSSAAPQNKAKDKLSSPVCGEGSDSHVQKQQRRDQAAEQYAGERQRATREKKPTDATAYQVADEARVGHVLRLFDGRFGVIAHEHTRPPPGHRLLPRGVLYLRLDTTDAVSATNPTDFMLLHQRELLARDPQAGWGCHWQQREPCRHCAKGSALAVGHTGAHVTQPLAQQAGVFSTSDVAAQYIAQHLTVPVGLPNDRASRPHEGRAPGEAPYDFVLCAARILGSNVSPDTFVCARARALRSDLVTLRC
jgi:hypothetical protein